MNKNIRSLLVSGALIGFSICGCDGEKKPETEPTAPTPPAQKQAAVPNVDPPRPAAAKPPATPALAPVTDADAIKFAEADFRSHWGSIDNAVWDAATVTDWKVETSAAEPGKKIRTHAVPGTWATQTPQGRYVTGTKIICTVTILPISEADKANGVQWQGLMTYSAGSWRDYGSPKPAWRDGPGSYGIFSRDIVCTNGKWSSKFTPRKGIGDFSVGTPATASDLPK